MLRHSCYFICIIGPYVIFLKKIIKNICNHNRNSMKYFFIIYQSKIKVHTAKTVVWNEKEDKFAVWRKLIVETFSLSLSFFYSEGTLVLSKLTLFCNDVSYNWRVLFKIFIAVYCIKDFNVCRLLMSSSVYTFVIIKKCVDHLILEMHSKK